MLDAGNGDMRLSPVAGLALGRERPGGGVPHPGQLIRARVEQVEPDGAFLVRAGAQTLRLGAGMQLAVGQELLLRMMVGNDGPRYAVLRSMPGNDEAGAADGENPVVSTLQRMAVRQQPLAGLLAHLSSGDDDAPLLRPEALLRSRLLSPGDLVQPGHLRDAIRDAGLLLEARLAAATAEPGLLPAVVSNDFKLLLWRLLGGDNGVLDEAFRELLEGLLAHLSLRQLNSIRMAEQGHFFWSLELPMVWGQKCQPVAITLRHQRSREAPNQSSERSWEVAFALELESMGALEVQLYLRGQRISVSLEAERPATVQVLHGELRSLQEALSLQGFQVDSMISRPRAESATDKRADTFRDVSALGGGV